jgi:hypothetical protein
MLLPIVLYHQACMSGLFDCWPGLLLAHRPNSHDGVVTGAALLRGAFHTQVRVLCVRNVRFYTRNPELLLAKLFTYIFMGGFMGARAPFLPLQAECLTPHDVCAPHTFSCDPSPDIKRHACSLIYITGPPVSSLATANTAWRLLQHGALCMATPSSWPTTSTVAKRPDQHSPAPCQVGGLLLKPLDGG